MGATFFVTGLRRRDRSNRTTQLPRAAVPFDHAFRLVVETTLFHTVSSAVVTELPARVSTGLARSVDFSNDAVWSALCTEAFATAARTTAFDPDAEHSGAGSHEAAGVPVVLAVLRRFTQHPDHQLLVSCQTARARAVIALLEGDRDGFVRAVRTFQTATTDAAILAFASRTRGWPCAPSDPDKPTAEELAAFQASYNAEFDQSIRIDGQVGDQTRAAYFDLFEADAAERADTDDALAWLRRRLDHVVPDREDPISGEREHVEVLFVAPPEHELVTTMARWH